jgi:ubiquinone/menaquinone biosynthesis C-methylase UbiE
LAAEAWAELAELIDLQLSPLGLQARAALAPRPGEVIVDVGCGAGQTVAQLAERVATDGQVIGSVRSAGSCVRILSCGPARSRRCAPP